MKNIFILFFLLFNSCFVLAHPGIGIVKDGKGNIYYTDLKQVWKVTPDGKKTAVVKNVHTHELYMDPQYNLYGEHLWYNGERLNTWGHYVWCLKNTGELVKEIEPTEGFLNNYSFVRDSSGNMYWVERFTVSHFMKKDTTGKVSKLAEGKFGFIGWLYCTSDGIIYFSENNKLHKLARDGKFILLANDLQSNIAGFTGMGRQYDSYGIWADKADNIYIAMIGAKKVNRISPDGRIQTIIYSNSLWTPCSGLFDDDGNMWLMEFSLANETRVRKISKIELAGIIPAKPFVRQTQLLITVLSAVAVAALWFLLKQALHQQKRKLQTQLT